MKLKLCIAAAAIFASMQSLSAQGNLTPPGAPAPTMQTLDQIGTKADQANTKVDQLNAKAEKRIPISSVPITIMQSGSYYLTADLQNSGAVSAIRVSTDNVTIDLNGFTLNGATSTGQGIQVGGNNVVIKNGKIVNFSGSAVQGAGFYLLTVENVSVRNNNGGIESLGDRSVVRQCSVFNSKQGDGIHIESGLVENCVVELSTVGAGISTGNYAAVRNCVVTKNSTGILANGNCMVIAVNASANTGNGISAGDGSAIIDCTAGANGAYGIYGTDGVTISRCTSQKNIATSAPLGIGIRGGNKSRITDCTVSDNSGDGIQFINYCLITGNLAANNGTGTAGDGLHSFGSGSRIDSNQAQNNKGSGVHWDGAFDLVTRNTSRKGNNVLSYNPASGASMAPVQSPDSATSPWANF